MLVYLLSLVLLWMHYGETHITNSAGNSSQQLHFELQPSQRVPMPQPQQELTQRPPSVPPYLPALPPSSLFSPPPQSPSSSPPVVYQETQNPSQSFPPPPSHVPPQPGLVPPVEQNRSSLQSKLAIEKIRLTRGCLFALNVIYPIEEGPCVPVFNIAYIDTQPYSGDLFRYLINKTLETCCKRTLRTINYKQTLDVDEEGSDADFIYPVLSETNSPTVYGHHFIPIIAPPGAFYVTKRPRFSMKYLLWSCLELWPLLVISIVISAIAGFFAWLFETKGNEEEFPRSFFRGWFEGTWWSFISMTTVGYGDKVPRSVGGRLFSVVWIFAGIIVFNILAGELTTEILQAKIVGEPPMAEKRIGALDRLYEQSLVTRNGGRLVRTSAIGVDEMRQFRDLIDHLKSGHIDGFLLDKYSYQYFKDAVEEQDYLQKEAKDKNSSKREDLHTLEKHLSEFYLQKTMISNVEETGEDLSYGLLVRNKGHFEYFADTFRSNKLAFKSIITMNFKFRTELKTPHNGFHLSVIEGNGVAVLGVFAAIFLFGVSLQLYQYWRSYKKIRSISFKHS